MNKKTLISRLEDLIKEGETVRDSGVMLRSGQKLPKRESFSQWQMSCLEYLAIFKDRPYLASFKNDVKSRLLPNVKRGLGILRSLNNTLEKGYIPIEEEKAKKPEADNYVDEGRIKELANLPKDNFDTTRLVKLCEELNRNYKWKNYFAVGALLRTILDHVPPIFEMTDFEHVANNYSWGRSHKSLIMKLCESAKKIAHNLLHKQIKKSKVEVLPKKQRVDFRAEIDILLAEIVTILKSRAQSNKSA